MQATEMQKKELDKQSSSAKIELQKVLRCINQTITSG